MTITLDTLVAPVRDDMSLAATFRPIPAPPKVHSFDPFSLSTKERERQAVIMAAEASERLTEAVEHRLDSDEIDFDRMTRENPHIGA